MIIDGAIESVDRLRCVREASMNGGEVEFVMVLDGKAFASDQLVIALGVTATGEKRILGLVQTASEIRRVIASFLRALGERGVPVNRPLLVVLDGSKRLRAAVRDVFGDVPHADDERALQRLVRELRVVTESAAARLEEGPEETLTLHRLNVFPSSG